jgi:hypothetical protein
LSAKPSPRLARPKPTGPARGGPSEPCCRLLVLDRDSTGVQHLPVSGVRAAHGTNSRAAPL